MTRTILAMATLLSVFAVGLQAQETPRERAERTLPAEVLRELSALAVEMDEASVPTEPLYAKALEGAAKRVPAAMLLPAVRSYAGRLGDARQAFGLAAPTPLIVAGADAIQRGVTVEALRGLPSDRPRSPMAVVALADLLESGVPVDRALAILREIMSQRVGDDRMLDVSARVRRLIRDGLTPQEAIDRVRRNLQRLRDGSLGPPVPPGSTPVVRDGVGDRLTDGAR